MCWPASGGAPPTRRGCGCGSMAAGGRGIDRSRYRRSCPSLCPPRCGVLLSIAWYAARRSLVTCLYANGGQQAWVLSEGKAAEWWAVMISGEHLHSAWMKLCCLLVATQTINWLLDAWSRLWC